MPFRRESRALADFHISQAEGNEPPTGPRPGYRIVGIVADTKYDRLRRDVEPTMFWPLVSNQAYFELRTAADPNALVPQVRQIVSRVDNNLPLFDVRTQAQQIERATDRRNGISSTVSVTALRSDRTVSDPR